MSENHRILFISFSIILLLLLQHHNLYVLAKGQLVQDCNSTPSLENVNEVRKFVDNCIKTKDGIRFRKRQLDPIPPIKSRLDDYWPKEIGTASSMMLQPSTTRISDNINNQSNLGRMDQSLPFGDLILLRYLMNSRPKSAAMDQ